MLDFPNSPTTGQIFSSGKGTWDGTKWVPVFAGALGDAPSDGSLYGRLSAAWSKAVKLAGDTMTGALLLNADPTAALGAATKQYVDGKTASIGGGVVAFNSYASSQTTTIPAGATKALVELWGGTGGFAQVLHWIDCWQHSHTHDRCGGNGRGGKSRRERWQRWSEHAGVWYSVNRNFDRKRQYGKHSRRQQ
jgi:hypothetical protein